MEAQFDFNYKLHDECRRYYAEDIRMTPIGKDRDGQVYWFFVVRSMLSLTEQATLIMSFLQDKEKCLQIYREDDESQSWTLICQCVFIP